MELCLQVDKNNTKAWYRKGLLLQALERHEEAQACFDKMSAISLGGLMEQQGEEVDEGK